MSVFARAATRTAELAGSSRAFGLALLVVVVWAACGPVFRYSDTWQLVVNTGTTIVTFLMVFLLQHAQARDARAVQAKLDALLRGVDRADERLVGIEHDVERG